ncbi:MAG: cobalt transport protein CbiN [Peptoniphilus sp.]|nr:cobalt transport protein CbiN [Peptoniphilus sp.]MDY6044695.1 cobalt transport protein CbiN [Peptoniphilus sp.]
MKNSKKAILLIILCVVIAVVPLLMIKNSDFGGADDRAKDVISELNPNYKPWFEPVVELPGGETRRGSIKTRGRFEPVVELPGGETESLLFALQAAIGSGVIGLGFGYLIGRKKYKKS